MSHSETKLREFIEEARALTQQHSFSGPENKAMFWGHTADADPKFNINGASYHGRNNVLCALYMQSADPDAYKLDTLNVIDQIGSYFDRWAGSYPAEILDEAWDVYSEAFANQARGDHIFIAANDMRDGDYFDRIELPIIRERFSKVTILEPDIDTSGMFACKVRHWDLEAWIGLQENQWKSPYYYLDGTPYPKELRPPPKRMNG